MNSSVLYKINGIDLPLLQQTSLPPHTEQIAYTEILEPLLQFEV